MVFRTRGQLIEPTDVANLTVTFYDSFGNPANTTGFPKISIVQPSGLVALLPTSAGVSQIDVGKYLFQFTAPFNGPFGVWNDVWQGTVNGVVNTNTLSFIIEHTDLPQINSDGYVHIGDNPGFDYSQTAIRNINKILKVLKARLNNDGKAKSTDAYGNIMYVDCSVFSVDMLVTFIAMAITDFNQIPYFTFFTFDDTMIIDQFLEIFVESATLYALASQALIERGREYVVSDNGVSFTPPTVSELLTTQWSTLLNLHLDKLKYIKNSMRPSPLGLGLFGVSNSNPAFRRLRSLRARQII